MLGCSPCPSVLLQAKAHAYLPLTRLQKKAFLLTAVSSKVLQQEEGPERWQAGPVGKSKGL